VQLWQTAAGHSSLDGLPDLGRAVGDDQRRRPHAVVDQIARELQPLLVALARSQLQPEQHLGALQRQAPGDQYAFGGLVVQAQLEVDRVQVAVDEVVLVQAALTPGAVALTGVLADPCDGRLADDLLAQRLLQQSLDVSERQALRTRR
jgi:hypothetical protein